MLDVGAASEDALKVDPATLDIDPHVKQRHDAVQLVLPAQSILLKHLDKKTGSALEANNVKLETSRFWRSLLTTLVSL